MAKKILLFSSFYFLAIHLIFSQLPLPCGPNPAMTSTCATACVICDIDGFTGNNNLTAQGQTFPQFCTIGFNNIQYIAFVAGSTDLTIRVDVGNCVGGNNNLEVGFFESLDCDNFTPITDCDTNIPQNTSQVFETFVPLVIGQHYYLIIDGSNSANCDWTFNVLEGTTELDPLGNWSIGTNVFDTCPNVVIPFSAESDNMSATMFNWTINGVQQTAMTQDVEFSFPTPGSYEVCVVASNVCDEAPPICLTIPVIDPGSLAINEVLCEGECIEANGVQYCETGSFQEVISLPNGCDSIITIDLVVLDVPMTNVDVWICSDDFFNIGPDAFNMTGTYDGAVLTDNGCDSLVFLELLVIECEITGNTSEIPATCTGTASGTLLFSIDQGEAPFNFTYTNIEDGTITGTGTTSLLNNNEIPNIAAGTYQIYIEDGFGNDVVMLQEVTEPPPLAMELIPSDYGGFNVSCLESNGVAGNDGTMTANMSGGVPPYTYAWSNGQTSQTATDLIAAPYFVLITDAVGCTISTEFMMLAPFPIVPTISFGDPNCSGFETGIIEIVEVTGGVPPFTYSLSDTDFQTDPIFSELTEGTYFVSIMDANGCVEVVESSILAPDIPVITPIEDQVIQLGESVDLDAFVDVNTLGSIQWSDSTTLSCSDCLDPTAMPLNDVLYSLVVSSADGCTDSTTAFIRVEKFRNVYVPNIFSPNDDGFNDVVNIFAGPDVLQVSSFRIFNRWGSILFEQFDFLPNDAAHGWDGRFRGKLVNPDIFVWTAVVEFIDGEALTYGGDIAIVR